jgi:hypothetical protein
MPITCYPKKRGFFRVFGIVRQFVPIAVSILALLTPWGSVRAELLVPREQHPWGRFKTGAWKQVRVVTESLDAQGKATGVSKTETKSTLVELDESGYMLEIEVTVEVAGKRFSAQPQFVRQGFNGEAEGQKLISFKNLGSSTCKINGREIESDVRQLVLNGGEQKRTTTVHYAGTVEPYVLKRETSTTDAAGQTTFSQNLVEVLALDMPLKIRGKMRTVSHTKTVSARPSGKTITLETHCLDVPGTVVSHTSKELDESDRVVRRSTLELVDFAEGDGDDGKNARRRLFGRRPRKSGS